MIHSRQRDVQGRQMIRHLWRLTPSGDSTNVAARLPDAAPASDGSIPATDWQTISTPRTMEPPAEMPAPMQLPDCAYLGRQQAAGQFSQYAAEARGLLQRALRPHFPQEVPPQAPIRAVEPLLVSQGLRGRPQPFTPMARTYAGLGLNSATSKTSPWSSIVASGIPAQG